MTVKMSILLVHVSLYIASCIRVFLLVMCQHSNDKVKTDCCQFSGTFINLSWIYVIICIFILEVISDS